MPTYNVQLCTDVEFAETKITARNSREAMASAQALEPDALQFERFTTLPINEITIEDQNGVTIMWRSPDLLTRLAAEDLYIASRNLLTMLNREFFAFTFGRYTLEMIDTLEIALKKAEGWQS